jgi:hypothetical protein
MENILYKNNVEIVISRYNEDLMWLNEYPFNQFEYIVYNKGDNELFNKTNVKKIVNLQNVGRCDHTYLHHICDNYDNLSDIVVFFPGSVDIKEKKIKAICILENIIKNNYKKAFFVGNYCNSVKNHFKNFKINNHKCADSRNFMKNNETELFKCVIRPYGNWYDYFFKNIQARWYTFSGIFSIDKRDITQNPVDKYIILKNIVGVHSHPESGHYIERSWGAIFYPLNNTVKIKENSENYTNKKLKLLYNFNV